VLNRIERFRPIVNEPFLDRGTVRRGGQRGSILEFVKFAYELENMLLHIFRWKRRQAERPAEKRIGTARAASFSGDGLRI
jgi:hypothetical protein